MSVNMLFLIGAPRSGTTMLERILSSHSQILGGPEPHIITPLAHLGVWAKVDKAPYDHILSAESQKIFVESLPNGIQDYWAACRAYCDVLYGRYLSTGANKQICLDKTPAYALVLPFLMKVFADAKYVTLTRHPLAMFSSYANSFFDGDYELAHKYNPIVLTYVPALARFIRQTDVANFHVKYEELVKDPESWMERIYAHIGVGFERETIEYGKGGGETGAASRKGLGDPIGVGQHSRPSTQSVKKWVEELLADKRRLDLMRRVIEQVDGEDLETIGYPRETLWKPLEEAEGAPVAPKRPRLDRYRLQRKAIITLRRRAQKGGLFHKLLKKAQLTCDVLLRDQ